MIDYPQSELYMSMDCGSGHDFGLPHISAADKDGPTKMLDGVGTVPPKVCNLIVHGDENSYVVLSPGVVGATANHTIENILIVINATFQNLKSLPSMISVQFDGASVNKSILVMAVLALYVLERVFLRVRVRCEMEFHAHDIYDQYHSIHAGLVRRTTTYFWEDLIHLIKAAHTMGKHSQCAEKPLVGRNVNVFNLWEVRDFWEWLVPGYTNDTTRQQALTMGAFVAFGKFQNYRDFMVELIAGSTEGNPTVGLWAKPYMTSEKYEYLGTLLTRNSFDSVTKGKKPVLQTREVSDTKLENEKRTMKQLDAVLRSEFSAQFKGKLSDAYAICKRDWDYFKNSSGELTP